MSKVTVLMSVYNGERYLMEAIHSILNQTWRDFEFLIINDGSTDDTQNILTSFTDKRIKIENNLINIGLTKSLNRGLDLTNGDLIARQDADDISLPQRLERQISYFKSHPNIALLGTWANSIDANGKTISKICPISDPSLLKWRLIFKNQIIHSSIMFDKKKVLTIGAYDPDIKYAQDYDLWSRILMRYEVHQIPEIMIHLRNHSENISRKNLLEQKEAEIRRVRKNLTFLLNKPISMEDAYNIRVAIEERPFLTSDELEKTADLLHELYLNFIGRLNPNLNDTSIVTADYSTMMKILASKHANIQRKGTYAILKKATQAKSTSIFEFSTLKCLLKILLGPRNISRYYHLQRHFKNIS